MEYLKKVFVAAKETNEIWEVDCFLQDPTIDDPKGRPRFPFCYLVVNAGVGSLYHVSVVEKNDHGDSLIK